MNLSQTLPHHSPPPPHPVNPPHPPKSPFRQTLPSTTRPRRHIPSIPPIPPNPRPKAPFRQKSPIPIPVSFLTYPSQTGTIPIGSTVQDYGPLPPRAVRKPSASKSRTGSSGRHPTMIRPHVHTRQHNHRLPTPTSQPSAHRLFLPPGRTTTPCSRTIHWNISLTFHSSYTQRPSYASVHSSPTRHRSSEAKLPLKFLYQGEQTP